MILTKTPVAIALCGAGTNTLITLALNRYVYVLATDQAETSLGDDVVAKQVGRAHAYAFIKGGELPDKPALAKLSGDTWQHYASAYGGLNFVVLGGDLPVVTPIVLDAAREETLLSCLVLLSAVGNAYVCNKTPSPHTADCVRTLVQGTAGECLDLLAWHWRMQPIDEHEKIDYKGSCSFYVGE